jgi:hypothetical protein
MSDTKKFRAALNAVGVHTGGRYPDAVFNDKHKGGTRRLKLWGGSRVFALPRSKQVKLEEQLEKQFGTRYLFGEFIRRGWDGKSFIVYLLD